MEFIGHSGSVLCCCVFKTFIVSAGYDKVIRVWDAEHGTIIESLSGHEHIISSIDIFQHPNCGSDENGHQKHSQPIIISGSWDRSVCVWKLPTIKAHPLISNMKSHKHEIITANKSEEKCKWLKFKMEGHKNRIKCVRAVQPQQHPHQNAGIPHPDSVNYCASGSDDGIIIVWNIDTGTQHMTLYGHTHFILQLAVYLDVEQDSVRNGTESGGRYRLVSHSSDRTLRVWCLSSGEQISSLDLSSSDIVSVDMSSSGTVDNIHGGDGPVLGDKLQGIAFNDSFLSTADQQSQKTPTTLTNSNSYANSSHHWSGMGSVVMSRQNSSLSVDSAAGRAATDIFSLAIVTLSEDTVQAMTAGQLGLNLNHTTEHYQDSGDQQHVTQSWRPVLVVSDKSSNLLLYSLPYHIKTTTDNIASDSNRHRQALSLLYSVNSVNVTANVTARSAHSAHSSHDDTPIVIPPYVVSIATTTALDTALWTQNAIHMQNTKMKSLLASSSSNSSVSSNSGSGCDTRNNSVSRALDGCFITYVTDRGFVGYVDLLQTAQSSGRSGTYDLSQAVPLNSPSTNKVVSVNKHKSNPNSNSGNGSMSSTVTYNLIAVSSSVHDPSAGVSPHRNNQHNSTGSSYIAVCGDDGTLLVRKFNLHEAADAHRNSNRSVVTPAVKLPEITSPQPPNKQKVSGGINKRSGADSRIVDPDDSGVTTSQQRHLLKNYQKLVYDGADPLLLDDSSSGGRPRNFNGDEDSNCSNVLTGSADNSGSGATFWQSIVGDAQFSFARIKFNAKDKTAGGGAAGGGSGMNSGANSARRNHPNDSNSNSGGSVAASAANRNARPQRGAQQPTTTQNTQQTRNNKNANNRRPYDLATNNTASTTTVAQLMQQNNQSIQNTGTVGASNSRVLLSPLPGLSALSSLQTQSHPTLSTHTAGAGASDGDYVTSLLLSHLPPKKTMNHLYDVNGGSVGGNNGRGNTNRGSANSRQRGVGSVGRRLLMPLFS